VKWLALFLVAVGIVLLQRAESRGVVWCGVTGCACILVGVGTLLVLGFMAL
jgi:uncharacterized membrane protein YjjB (DUF3815 family)